MHLGGTPGTAAVPRRPRFRRLPRAASAAEAGGTPFQISTSCTGDDANEHFGLTKEVIQDGAHYPQVRRAPTCLLLIRFVFSRIQISHTSTSKARPRELDAGTLLMCIDRTEYV